MSIYVLLHFEHMKVTTGLFSYFAEQLACSSELSKKFGDDGDDVSIVQQKSLFLFFLREGQRVKM